MYKGHWIVDDFDIGDYIGFVYLITNNIDNRKYIGCKVLHNKIKRPPLKGKKNKRHSLKESDWTTYTGSSTSLNEDIDKLGKHNFTFEILSLHDSKWSLKYEEAKQIILNDAIPNKSFYNGYLCRIGRCPAKETK